MANKGMCMGRILGCLARIAYVMMCMLFVSMAVPAKAFATEPNTLRVGIFDTAGYYGNDDAGRPSGYGYAYLGEIAKVSPLYMITAYDKADIMDQLNDALEQIQVSKPSFNTDLYNKYFESESSVLQLTLKETEYIKNHKPIKVVYDSNWAPFESFDKVANAPVGINADIMKRIAEKTGLSFEYINGFNYDEAIKMVSNGEADMLLSYDTNSQKGKELNIQLSDTFLDAPIAIIGKEYNITPKSVFAVPGTYTIPLAYIQRHFPNNKIITLRGIEDCYAAIQNGDADFTAENIYAANCVIQYGTYGSLVVASITTQMDRFSFAFNADTDYQLISIINKGILTVSEAEKAALILAHTTNMGSERGRELFVKRYRVMIMFVFLVLFITLIAGLFIIILQQMKNRKALWKMAYVDELTGLSNLNKFKMDAKKLLSDNPNKRYVMALLDINKFNLINEIYGFPEGDRVLLALKDGLYGFINPAIDLIARKDSDEFLIFADYDRVMLDGSEHDGFSGELKEYMLEKTGHKLRFSVGRYLIKPGENDIDAVFEKVNYAHSMAKQSSPVSEIYDYDDDMKKQAIRHREIENKMEAALNNNEFIIYLQPKYRLEDERLTGAEALVRWQEKTGKDVVYPSEFVPLFEKNGFIVRLDMYMFKKACEIISGWMGQGLPLTTISVNFSRIHLQNPDFVDEIIAIADSFNVPKRYLEIELTESTIFDNEAVLEDVLVKLHNVGFTLSMDDFGTGYSSLGLLKNLPVDVIKIDRAFFTNNRYKSRARTVIESVVKMAKDLDIHTVAEGVETFEHVEFLREIGCESVQGYYFAKPMPAADFSTQSFVVTPDRVEADYKLDIKLLGDIALGRGVLGVEMPVAVYRLFEFAIREALSERYGEGEMEETMRMAGKISGRVFASEILDLSLEFNDFIDQLTEKWREMKIGLLRLERLEAESGAAVITIRDDLDCSGTKDEGKVICNYDEGFIAGVLYEYTKKIYTVVEIDCWGNGSDVCRFEVIPK